MGFFERRPNHDIFLKKKIGSQGGNIGAYRLMSSQQAGAQQQRAENTHS